MANANVFDLGLFYQTQALLTLLFLTPEAHRLCTTKIIPGKYEEETALRGKGHDLELQFQCFFSSHIKHECFSEVEIYPGLWIPWISKQHSK